MGRRRTNRDLRKRNNFFMSTPIDYAYRYLPA